MIHSGKTFDCEICLKSYSDRSALRRHQIAIHGEASVRKHDSEYEAIESITSSDEQKHTIDPMESVTYSFEPKSSDTNDLQSFVNTTD